jgi:hypothetical protein
MQWSMFRPGCPCCKVPPSSVLPDCRMVLVYGEYGGDDAIVGTVGGYYQGVLGSSLVTVCSSGTSLPVDFDISQYGLIFLLDNYKVDPKLDSSIVSSQFLSGPKPSGGTTNPYRKLVLAVRGTPSNLAPINYINYNYGGYGSGVISNGLMPSGGPINSSVRLNSSSLPSGFYSGYMVDRWNYYTQGITARGIVLGDYYQVYGQSKGPALDATTRMSPIAYDQFCASYGGTMFYCGDYVGAASGNVKDGDLSYLGVNEWWGSSRNASIIVGGSTGFLNNTTFLHNLIGCHPSGNPPQCEPCAASPETLFASLSILKEEFQPASFSFGILNARSLLQNMGSVSLGAISSNRWIGGFTPSGACVITTGGVASNIIWGTATVEVVNLHRFTAAAPCWSCVISASGKYANAFASGFTGFAGFTTFNPPVGVFSNPAIGGNFNTASNLGDMMADSTTCSPALADFPVVGTKASDNGNGIDSDHSSVLLHLTISE